MELKMSQILLFVLFAISWGYQIPLGFPSPHNTGIAGVGLTRDSLTPSAQVRVTIDKQIIEYLDITGGIIIEADSVVVRNCHIKGGLYGIHCVSGRGIIIEDCTFDDGGDRKAINAENCLIRRCDISGYQDGIWLRNNVVVEECYFHNLYTFDAAHADYIQSSGGVNYLIKGNTFIPCDYQNAAIIIQTMFSAIDSVSITNNYIGGGNYALYFRKRDQGTYPQNCTISENVFIKESWGTGIWSLEGEEQGIWNSSLGNNRHNNNMLDDGSCVDINDSLYCSIRTDATHGDVICNPQKDRYLKNSYLQLDAKADSGYSFKCWEIDSSVTSTDKNLTIILDKDREVHATFHRDTIPPELIRVQSTDSGIDITFNEALHEISASNKDNYTIDNSVSIDSVLLAPDLKSVRLCTSKMESGSVYTLSIKGIADYNKNYLPVPLVQEFKYIASDISRGLVAYYAFDKLSSGSTVDSANPNSAVAVYGASLTEGYKAKALTFNGTSDYVDLGNPDISSGKSEMAISIWIKPTVLNSSDGRFISKASGVQESEHYWMISTVNRDQLRFRLKTDGVTTTLIAANEKIEPDMWNHIVANYDGEKMSLYLNSVLIGEKEKQGSVSTSSDVLATIGSNPTQTNFFNGAIDEVRVYNRALTEADIIELGNNTVSLLGSHMLRSESIDASVINKRLLLHAGNSVETVTVKVYNALGRLVLQKNRVQKSVDVALLSQGIYVVLIEKGNEKMIKNMVIK